MRPGRPLAAACLLLLSAGPARADLLLNECLADPAGPDAGAEFVEIHNPGPDAAPLGGVRLEFANGADGVWTVRWTAPSAATLAAGGFLLVADAGWAGEAAPDAVVSLGLQNGPDAVRLVRGDEVLDVLGYGTPLAADLREGDAAAAAHGAALARRPDGRDTDDNARDWVAAAPTPGAPNFARHLLAAVALACEPPSVPWTGDPVEIAVAVRNAGWDAWPGGEWRGRVGLDAAPGAWAGLAPGDTTVVRWRARPAAAGRLPVQLEVAGPVAPFVTVPAGTLQVGPGALLVHEVMAAPDDGQGEWVELAARAAVDLAGHVLRDADGGEARLAPRALAPGELVVLSPSPAALLAREDTRSRPGACGLAGTQVVAPTGWPSLNNTAPAGRAYADRLLLVDPAGVVVDHVVVGPGGAAPAGRSWERVAPWPPHPGAPPWAVATHPAGGTPGCANSVATDGGTAGDLAAVPRVLDARRGTGTLRLRFTLAAGAGSWRLALADVWGAVVRRWQGDDLGPGPREVLWFGEDDGGAALPPGAYVAALVVRDAAGRVVRRDRALVVVR